MFFPFLDVVSFDNQGFNLTEAEDIRPFGIARVVDRSSRKISDPTSWGSGSPSIARGKMSLPEIVLEVKSNDRQFRIFTVLQKKSEEAEHVKCSELCAIIGF